MITFNNITTKEKYQILEFDIDGGVCSPDELPELKLPALDNKKGLIISGRGPVWLYGFLVHQCHAFPWVATNDPRLGAVVVESHTSGVAPGDIIEV